MPATIVSGLQFGDEGKGKIVDLLSEKADLVCRFQGGDNAGHTVVVGDATYKLHLIPSGFLQKKRTLIGAGVVVNPRVFKKEAEEFNVPPGLLGVDLRATIIFPHNIEIDIIEEVCRKKRIGTTKRGIGPAYTDKAARRNVTLSELLDGSYKKILKEQQHANEVFLADHFSKDNSSCTFGQGKEQARTYVCGPKILEEFAALADFMRPFATDASREVNDALKDGKTVLCETAQGAFLDNSFGTRPYVTSSSTISGAACTGLGFAPWHVKRVVGVSKAYMTRVGEGPMPSEIEEEIGNVIRSKGAEFGTTTGRARRCGWLDLPVLRRACELNGATELTVTKLDVLSGMKKVKVCKYYRLDGKKLLFPPVSTNDFERARPVYKEFLGWQGFKNPKDFSSLPRNAKNFLNYVEGELKILIKIVSFGPERNQNIYK